MTAAPRPGPVHGLYPQRSDHQAAWLAPPWVRWRQRAWALRRSVVGGSRMQQLRRNQAHWLSLGADAHALHLARLRLDLAKAGWSAAKLRARALGCVAAAMHRTLHRDPYDTQLHCADLLLQGRLAEMATGEGKTLAVALAAAVAALAGVPVHVMTANDYLVLRDAQQLQPFFAALALRNSSVVSTSTPDQRRAAYANHVTHCTAREVAFDHLRDREHLQHTPNDLQLRAQRLANPQATPLLLRGLCMALVDEADSLLIDEATVPLVLAQTSQDPQERAACFQALAVARSLALDEHARVDEKTHAVTWTPAGLTQLHLAAEPLGGAWHNRRHRQDLVGTALVALHGVQRDHHYLVRDGQVQLLDAHTGRVAQGRMWSRGLQTLVELKEGCKLSPTTRTCAQTSYQRFFARYLFLAGTSGTLAECSTELARVYGLQVVAVPLRQANRRVVNPAQRFGNASERAGAVAQQAAALVGQGRPVLVGVATVAQAELVSQHLVLAGVEHRVLDARHDADEAAIVAAAGQAGHVTVATALAGRGTDIELGPGVLERGGLHVINCQDNHSARLDRQLLGRCARQGDPGSADIWLTHTKTPGQDTEAPHALDLTVPGCADQDTALLEQPTQPPTHPTRQPLAKALSLVQRLAKTNSQRAFERQQARRRHQLLEQDLIWERQLDFKNLHA
jgi:preprotein translocase subunit SecA